MNFFFEKWYLTYDISNNFYKKTKIEHNLLNRGDMTTNTQINQFFFGDKQLTSTCLSICHIYK